MAVCVSSGAADLAKGNAYQLHNKPGFKWNSDRALYANKKSQETIFLRTLFFLSRYKVHAFLFFWLSFYFYHFSSCFFHIAYNTKVILN